MTGSFLRNVVRYLRHEAGVAAIVLAISMPMLVAAVGVGVDLATAYNAKNRLSNALDKATLAAASTNGTDEQVRAQGITWLAARWGGAFTGPLVIAVFKLMDWRNAFAVFGAIGVVWAVFFYRWYRDNPADHPSVNKAELAIIQKSAQKVESHGDVPWGKLVGSGSVWPWVAPSHVARGSSCSTSRSPTWMRRCAPRFASRSSACTNDSARR